MNLDDDDDHHHHHHHYTKKKHKRMLLFPAPWGVPPSAEPGKPNTKLKPSWAEPKGLWVKTGRSLNLMTFQIKILVT